jgi:propionyl-CoA carboxylase beta chain
MTAAWAVDRNLGDASGASRQAARRLTADERLALLLDAGSFHPLGGRRRRHGGLGAGWGTINGRRVCLFAEPGTAGGTALADLAAIAAVQDLAVRRRAPVIGLFDAAAARLADGAAWLEAFGAVIGRSARLSRVAPQIAVVMGPCIGAHAQFAALADLRFMVRDSAHLFVAGPRIVRQVTNEVVSEDELGGALVHAATTGLADGVFADDLETLFAVRRLIDFLPASRRGAAPCRTAGDPATRQVPALDTLVPDDPLLAYDGREVVERIVDDGDFLELGAAFGPSLITGLARICGQTVGIVASQPLVLGGALDCPALRKAARFVGFCDAWRLPLVSFVDTPGLLPGTAQEFAGLAEAGARLLAAQARCTMPRVSVVTRNALGSATLAMGGKALGADAVYAWPTAHVALRRGAPGAGPGGGGIDRLIAPRDTRAAVAGALAAIHKETPRRSR